MVQMLEPKIREMGLPELASVPPASSIVRIMPPLPEDEGDLFNAGEIGHEKIERDALLPVVRDPSRVHAIYFGNWQRDMSQFLSPTLQKVPSVAPRLCNLLFDIVDQMAESKFGRRLDRARFGTYRWEEHIDNPREFGIAVNPWTCGYVQVRGVSPEAPEYPYPRSGPEQRNSDLWREGPGAVPRYMLIAQDYVLRQLGEAMRFGPHDPDARGLQAFGSAMHTVEDMYAHSNFIEIGYNLLGRSEDPKTGSPANGQGPLRDSMGRLRLITGVFLPGDTASSVSKLLLLHIEGIPPSGSPSHAAGSVIRVLVRHLLPSSMLGIYDRITQPSSSGGLTHWLGSHVPGLSHLEGTLEQIILTPLRREIAGLLRPLTMAVAGSTGKTVFPTPIAGRVIPVREISHSRLSKDDPHHPYHHVARQLAIAALRDFYQEMDRVWSRGMRPQGRDLAGTEFRRLVARYMNHPQAVGAWWQPILGDRRPSPPPSSPRPQHPGTGPPTLRVGSRGAWVRTLQERLNAALQRRTPTTVLSVDGAFGPRTLAAVRAFQQVNGLAVDGVVGGNTWAKLRET